MRDDSSLFRSASEAVRKIIRGNERKKQGQKEKRELYAETSPRK
jgi:hypothetical protein